MSIKVEISHRKDAHHESIFYEGNLVTDIEENIVLLVTCEARGYDYSLIDRFWGINLSSKNNLISEGNFLKDRFKQFHGTVKLTGGNFI